MIEKLLKGKEAALAMADKIYTSILGQPDNKIVELSDVEAKNLNNMLRASDRFRARSQTSAAIKVVRQISIH